MLKFQLQAPHRWFQGKRFYYINRFQVILEIRNFIGVLDSEHGFFANVIFQVELFENTTYEKDSDLAFRLSCERCPLGDGGKKHHFF